MHYDFRHDYDIALKTIKSYPQLYSQLPQKFQEMKLFAIKSLRAPFVYIFGYPTSLLNDEEFVDMTISDSSTILYLPYEMRFKEDLIYYQ